MTIDLKDICLKVVELAKKNGHFLINEKKNFDKSHIEQKGASELVSYVDKETEKSLVKGLREIFPDAGFITEESTVKTEDKEYLWIIDPLDGTTNFLHALPAFSISIALVKGNEVIVGVVHEPNLDESFYAWKKGGAFCNGKPISVSPVSAIADSLIATGFPYSQLDKSNNHFRIIQTLQDSSHGIRRLGSAAIDLAYVACGRFEAYYEFNLKIWDIAAGVLIVKEAGGEVTDFSGGNDYLGGKEVLATGNIHKEMLTVINEFWNN